MVSGRGHYSDGYYGHHCLEAFTRILRTDRFRGDFYRPWLPVARGALAAAAFETIDVSRDGPVAVVALARPQVRNAFNAQMIGELTRAFTSLSDSDARAVVLRGHGPTFSAGADVNWMRESLDYSTEENVEDARRMSDMFAAIDTCAKPVIAEIRGAALGGGMGLAAVSDIVVAESDATFGFTETRLGIIPAVISRFVLPKIGESWARALFLSGERFSASLAHEIGLVHWLVGAADLGSAVDAKISELLQAGPGASAGAKSLIRAIRDESDEEVRELTAQRIAAARTSPEGQEGLSAFLERRVPSWRP